MSQTHLLILLLSKKYEIFVEHSKGKLQKMKRMKFILIILTIAMALSSTGVVIAGSYDTDEVGITITEVYALLLAGDGNTSFTVGAPTNAGDAFLITPTNASSTKIQFTSIVENTETHKITADPNGNIPAGLTLHITAGAPGGTGTTGSTAGEKTFTTSSHAPVTIISGIGSGYTGTGSSGSVITYALTVTSGSESTIRAATTQTVTVTYTICE
jgi:hypothetical protein